MKKTLSKIPSEAIQQALEDMQSVIKDPDYVLDFDEWHSPEYIPDQFSGDKRYCSVCFAGSVMAKRLGADPKRDLYPKNFSERKMLEALDCFRSGNIVDAIKILRLKSKYKGPDYIEVDQGDLEEFTNDMQRIITELQKHGL